MFKFNFNNNELDHDDFKRGVDIEYSDNVANAKVGDRKIISCYVESLQSVPKPELNTKIGEAELKTIQRKLGELSPFILG